MSNNYTSTPDLSYLNLSRENAFYQLSVSELVEHAILNGEGALADSGALAIDTGKFTGRSPKDRYIVHDSITADAVYWGDINIQFDAAKFVDLQEQITAHINQRIFYVRDVFAGANPSYQISIRVISEKAYQSLFVNNMFLRESSQEQPGNNPEWTIIAAPSFNADPSIHGTRSGNFTIINFTKKTILIGGTGYTGEIKKGIFSVLNFILPQFHNVLPMHCSANVGAKGDTAVFFGLSGTGKTTLSADPSRNLIGDDEHGWSESSLFNFEGGCYAKCADLSADKEPEIFKAIRFGSLLENITFYPETREVDFANTSKTENTRVAYPLDYIENALLPSVSEIPENIFFLTADAFGVLPPVAKLDPAQAMFHFILGYTSKLAGTEQDIIEPQATFSACFGKAFLPLHPSRYASLLGEKMRKNNVSVWLINTGWSGGGYGVGKRIKLAYTRAIITAALAGSINESSFETDPVFGLRIPRTCPGVPSSLLNPKNTWLNPAEYDNAAANLAEAFKEQMQQYAEYLDEDVKGVMNRA